MVKKLRIKIIALMVLLIIGVASSNNIFAHPAGLLHTSDGNVKGYGKHTYGGPPYNFITNPSYVNVIEHPAEDNDGYGYYFAPKYEAEYRKIEGEGTSKILVKDYDVPYKFIRTNTIGSLTYDINELYLNTKEIMTEEGQYFISIQGRMYPGSDTIPMTSSQRGDSTFFYALKQWTSATIKIDDSTFVDQKDKSKIKYAKNPEKITLGLSEVDEFQGKGYKYIYKIIDEAGKVVKEVEIAGDDTNRMSDIDVESLALGTGKYIVEVTVTETYPEPYTSKQDGNEFQNADGTNTTSSVSYGGFEIMADPIINISKLVSDDNKDSYASPSEELTYTIAVSNDGLVDASGNIIKDDLKDVLPYIKDKNVLLTIISNKDSSKNTKDKTLSDLVSGLEYDLEIDEILTISFTVELIADLNIDKVTSIDNTATVNETIKDTANIETGAPGIGGTKNVVDGNKDGKAAPGEKLSYTITATNTGTTVGKNIVVKDTLASMKDYIQDSDVAIKIASDKDSTKNDTSKTLSALIAGLTYDIAVGETITITFDVYVKADLNVKNVTILSNILEVDDKEIPKEIEIGKPLWKVTKDVSDENKDGYAVASEILTYTITAKNIGDAKATKAIIKDTLLDVLPNIKEDPADVDVIVSSTNVVNDGKNFKLSELVSGKSFDVDIDEEITLVFVVTVIDELDIEEVTEIANIVTVVPEGQDEDDPDNGKADVEIPTGDIEWSVNKSVEDENKDNKAAPGEKLTYTVVATNTGSSTATAAIIQDKLADIKDYIKSTDISVTVTSTNSTNNGTITLTELMAGKAYNIKSNETITLVFTITLVDNLDTSKVTELVNIVTVGKDGEDNTEIETGKAAFTITKDVSDDNKDGHASPSEKLKYTITATNTGDATANKAKIKDTLSTLIPYIKSTDVSVKLTSTNASNNGIKTLSELMSGLEYNLIAKEVLVIEFEITLIDDLDVTTVQNLTNTVMIIPNGKDDNDQDNPKATENIKTGAPGTGGTKKVVDGNGDGKAAPGEKLTYTLTATNTGTVEAKDVVVKDTLASMKDYIQDSDVAIAIVSDKDSTKNDTSKTLSSLIAGLTYDIAAGETITISFDVYVKTELNVKNVTILSNTLEVDDKEIPKDIDTGAPEWEINKTVKDSDKDNKASASEILTYTITAKNIGDVKAKGIAKDNMSELLSNIKEDPEKVNVLVSSTNKENDGLNFKLSELIAGKIFEIDVNEEISFTYSVTIKDDFNAHKIKDLNNIVFLQTEGTSENDPSVVNDNALIETKGQPKLTATKVVYDCTGDDIAENGEELTYVIHIRNNGTESAYSVLVKDLFKDTEFTDSTIKKAIVSKDGVELRDDIDIVSGYTIDELEVGSIVKIEFDVELKNPIILDDAVLSNQADIISSNHDDILTTSEIDPFDPTKPLDDKKTSLPTEIDIKNPNLIGSKSVEDANKDGYVEGGETLTYTIKYKNTGDIVARNVIIKDPMLDDEFEKATISIANATKGENKYSGNIKDGINIGDLAINKVVVVVFIVKMPSDIVNVGSTPGVICNKAVAKGDNTNNSYTSSGTEPKESDPDDNTTIVSSKPKLTGTKVVKDSNKDGLFEPNEKIYYTLHFRNIGKVSAKDVVIKDPLSDKEFTNAKVSQAIATKGKVEYKGNIKKGINIGELKSNELVTVKFTVTLPSKITKDDKTPNVLVNQANAKGSNTDIVYTTSDIDPKDPTKPKNLTDKPKTTELQEEQKVPITGNDITFVLCLLSISVISIFGLEYTRMRNKY